MSLVLPDFLTLRGSQVGPHGPGRMFQGPYFSRPIDVSRFDFFTAGAHYSDLGEWGNQLGVQFQVSHLPMESGRIHDRGDVYGQTIPRRSGDDEWAALMRDGHPRYYRLRELRHDLSPFWGNTAMGYGTVRGPVTLPGGEAPGGPTYYGYEGRGENGGRGQPLGHLTPLVGLPRLRCALTVPNADPPPDAYVSISLILFDGMGL